MGSPGLLTVLILAHFGPFRSLDATHFSDMARNGCCLLAQQWSPVRVLLRAVGWPPGCPWASQSHQCTPRLASLAVVLALSWCPSLDHSLKAVIISNSRRGSAPAHSYYTTSPEPASCDRELL